MQSPTSAVALILMYFMALWRSGVLHYYNSISATADIGLCIQDIGVLQGTSLQYPIRVARVLYELELPVNPDRISTFRAL
jgi:hypothetical protein